MTPSHGSAAKASNLIRCVPHGHWHMTTLACGLPTSGLVAPLALDGAINGETFATCVERFLTPTPAAGDAVALDNLSSRKASGVREAIEQRSTALLYLLPHSPDLHPDRTRLLKIQAVAVRGQSAIEGSTVDMIGELLDRFAPSERANYIRHRGFVQSGCSRPA